MRGKRKKWKKWSGGLERIGKTWTDVLFPRRCIICEKLIAGPWGICKSCGRTLPVIGERYCMRCGKPLETEAELCGDCVRKRRAFDRGVSLWAYTPGVKASVYRFKYGNKRWYAEWYARAICRRYGKLLKNWQPDCLVPVPIHESRRRRRGYNQAELLARELSRRTGIPVAADLVVRRKKTQPQKWLDPMERKKNVRDAFEVVRPLGAQRRILLVDDVFTTGSTLDELAVTLKRAGAEKTWFVTLCSGRGFS